MTATEIAPLSNDTVQLAQRRTLQTLFITQVVGGVGNAIGISVGALLAADMVGVAVSGLATSAAVVGAALLAVPATRIVQQLGRRPSLAAAYGVAALGSAIVVAAAVTELVPLLFIGYFLFGGGSTAGLQARYAAVDLASDASRGRQLSLVVWATTLGAVTGPNLAPLAGTALDGYGIPPLAGPFAFSTALFILAAALLFALLRPDPFVLAQERRAATFAGAPSPKSRNGLREALAFVTATPNARLGMAATAVGHFVMVGVMSMTPVHILDAGHDAAHTLRIVGVVLSLHIAGMFAFAPLTGWMTDRFGRRPVILGGIAVLLLACAVAGTAGHGSTQLAVGLTLLGLGWSGTMVAGSTLLSESVPADLRAAAQGLSDITMGLAGATAGALSGVVVQAGGYPTLTLAAALATLPLVLLALRRTNEATRAV
jgi:MFS family permease